MSSSDPVVCIVGTSPVPLWGLDGSERLRRQFAALGITQTISETDTAAPGRPVVLLRADYLFDERTLRALLDHSGNVVLAIGPPGGATAVAAHVAAGLAAIACEVLSGKAAPQAIPDVTVGTEETLSGSYVGKLLKAGSPVVLPIRADRAESLERHLFSSSYKAVTDLVTKWVWPTPARWATRLCTRLGISPNAVTTASLVLTIVVTVLFARGRFAEGLLLGWIMTFLDTVDGKLARVTVTSTRFGHFFDHAIDLVHPPLWYLAWSFGVVGDSAQVWTLLSILVAIGGGYVVGRLIEGAFYPGLADFSLFIWRPFDSYFRLVTARRNPNLLLLSGFALAGFPRAGLVAVAWWTVLSTACLAIRLAQAGYVRLRRGQLQPWIRDAAEDPDHAPLYARPFISDDAAVRRLMR